MTYVLEKPTILFSTERVDLAETEDKYVPGEYIIKVIHDM